MRWGWLRFFFRGDDNIRYLIFQARKEKNGASQQLLSLQAANFLKCYDYESGNNKTRRDTTRQDTRYEEKRRNKEGGGPKTMGHGSHGSHEP
jgi:hypothetical protein